MIRSFGFGILASGLAYVTAPAYAQQQQCACQFDWVQGARSIGTITSVTGDVLITLPSGYGSAAEGAMLVQNQSVVVGPRSRALLSFRNGCSIEAVENTTVSLVVREAALCASVSQSNVAGAAGSAAAVGNSIVPLGIFTGLAGSAALLSLTQRSNDGPPPVSQ